MPAMQIFIIRSVLGLVVGVFLSRFFFPRAPLYFTIGLCVVLVALAYLSEYLRKRKTPMPHKKDGERGKNIDEF